MEEDIPPQSCFGGIRLGSTDFPGPTTKILFSIFPTCSLLTLKK